MIQRKMFEESKRRWILRTSY